ncbi:hypothetical protein GMSM_26040 [Geomonas sp. Red276]
MSEDELNYLADLLAKLRRASDTLRYSYEICRRIGVKAVYDEEERDRFESLTSKFARLSDLIVKQAIKIIDLLDLESAPESVRDAINRAEKKGLIASAVTFVEIRKLRNRISHEYVEPDGGIDEIYRAAVAMVPDLFDCVERVHRYSERYFRSGEA